ncbi:MAG: DUF2127 domain-containing protein [Terracidiphilus sp.]
MTDSPSPSLSRPRRRNRWLVLIAAYKFALALLFVAVGVGALRLLHKDIGDLLAQLAHHMRFNPESHFVDFILDKASLLNDPLLRRIGVAAFCYAALGMAEGIGLYLEKIWGEYLTLAITASFLPWELFEVFRRVTWIRASLLVINAMVFFYLLKLVVERGRQVRSSENE